jgi:DNA-binding MarR family transcriptional regulator
MYARIQIIHIFVAMTAEETIDFHIRWAWHSIARIYNSKGRPHNLSTSVGYVLLTIEKEGTPSTQLGPKMGMEPRSLTRTLKTMEEDGLLERKPDDKDGRKVLIHLTEEGKRMRAIAKNSVFEMNEGIRNALSPQQLADFYSTIKTINQHLDNRIQHEEKN